MEKRQRERVRREKQLDKERRKAQRVAQKQQQALKGGKDSDLAGMVPGPQPGQIID